jgi:hypothetical protein
MSRNSLVLILLGSLVAPASAYAQLTPPAGSAGAGNSAISGVPFGPANPSALSDPSGIGNAPRISPLGTNSPSAVYGPIGSSPSRVVAPYAGASQRIISADQVVSRRPPVAGSDTRPELAKEPSNRNLRWMAMLHARKQPGRAWQSSWLVRDSIAWTQQQPRGLALYDVKPLQPLCDNVTKGQ